jgi:hypothetical protein
MVETVEYKQGMINACNMLMAKREGTVSLGRYRNREGRTELYESRSQ